MEVLDVIFPINKPAREWKLIYRVSAVLLGFAGDI